LTSTFNRKTTSYPGHYCPGLIEASLTTGFQCGKSRIIRDIIASASLKQCSVFHGVFLFLDYPGHYCPGLIEASQSCCCAAAVLLLCCTLSGALLAQASLKPAVALPAAA
jgi:hypothetical protein